MLTDTEFHNFLDAYEPVIVNNALVLRKLILSVLPNITEQLDLPAKMVAYGYGQKYKELICVIIPSKKGLKLGFNQGASFKDPYGLLQGTGKITRYVVIENNSIPVAEITELLKEASELYRKRMS